MVMTRSGGSSRRKIVKGSSSKQGRIYDQEGLAMDPIDMEPLRFSGLIAIMHYGTSEDEEPTPLVKRKIFPSRVLTSRVQTQTIVLCEHRQRQ